jgi:RNA polymerase-interacting CarD/CdnL/TRCF family regulator
MQQTNTYAIGDWIAHSYYGIGQIESIEVKGISGEDADYFRIKANNSIFWVPVDLTDDETVRPLSSLVEIQQALDALNEPPELMSANHKLRNIKVVNAQRSNLLKVFAETIRDLRAFQQQQKVGLNVTERNALKSLKHRFAVEWATVGGMQTEKASSMLDDLANVGND